MKTLVLIKHMLNQEGDHQLSPPYLICFHSLQLHSGNNVGMAVNLKKFRPILMFCLFKSYLCFRRPCYSMSCFISEAPEDGRKHA